MDGLRVAAFISRFGFSIARWGENSHHGQVDAMTDDNPAVTTVVTRNYDYGPDPPIDLDRLAASLDCLKLHWGEPDTAGDSPGR